MSSRALFVIFIVVVAPVGAAVIVSVLLLFGVPPGVVFSPGWAVLGLLRRAGLHAPNAIGVVTTVGAWWLLLAIAGFARERARDRKATS